MKQFSTVVLGSLIGMAVHATVPSALPLPVSMPGIDPFEGLPGFEITQAEAASIDGGDVVMSLNASRTKMTVNVYTNDQELRRLNPQPLKVLVMDSHNRIVETIKAPFMPAPGSAKPAMDGPFTSKPASFPAGLWSVTGVKTATGSQAKYGPNIINTNAVGTVRVYDTNGTFLGESADVGYAIHSNTNGFAVSKSYGCVIIGQNDNAVLGNILRSDAASATLPGNRNGRPVQLFCAGDF
ncbi:MAG: hypothetical protein ACOYM2_08055 [Rectinemataceae bacterium]